MKSYESLDFHVTLAYDQKRYIFFANHDILCKRINCKQNAKWQHLYRLKANPFLLENYFVRC